MCGTFACTKVWQPTQLMSMSLGQQSGMDNYMPGRQRPCEREYKHEKGRPKGRPIMQNSKTLVLILSQHDTVEIASDEITEDDATIDSEDFPEMEFPE